MHHRVRKNLHHPSLGSVLVRALTGSAGLSVIGMFFTFLVGIQLARGLGAEAYGVYGFAMSVIALLTVSTEFGLPQLLTREVAAAQVVEGWGRIRGAMQWTTKVVLQISVGMAAVVGTWYFFAGMNGDDSFALTLLVGLAIAPAESLGNLRGAALRGLQHIVKGQLPGIVIRPAIFSLLLFGLSLSDFPLTPPVAIGLGALAAACAFFTGSVMLGNVMPTGVRHALPVVQVSKWWASAWPMALAEGMRVLQGHLAIILLGFFSTAATVGVFRVAISVAVFVSVSTTIHHIVGSPIIARLHEQGDFQKLQRMLSWMAVSMCMSTAMLSFPFVIAGDAILDFVFGEGFGKGNAALLILCGSAVVYGFFGTSAALLNMTGQQARVTRAASISLSVLVVLLPPLIVLYDEVGAAVATLLAMMIWHVAMWRDAKRILGLDSSVLGFSWRRESVGD